MSRRILYLQYSNPAAYPPLQHSAAILAERGWEVLFVGIQARGAGHMVMPAHERVQVHTVGGVSGGLLAPARYATFGAQALLQAARFGPDWCYASDAHSAPIALALRAMLHVPLVYHEHDAPPVSGARRQIGRARDRLARNAELVIAPSAARLELIPAGRGARVAVWNCPRLTEVAGEAEPAGDHFGLVYHGSLSRERLTPQFIDALALLPAHVQLHIYGYETQGHIGYIPELLQRAQQAGVAERVMYHGVIPERSQLLHSLRAHQLGIATVAAGSTDHNLRTLAGASNKAFEYLACGVPLLISRDPAWQKLYQQPGYAIDCVPTDAASIAEAVRSLLDQPARRAAIGRAGRTRILNEWNYEQQFAPVLAQLSA